MFNIRLFRLLSIVSLLAFNFSQACNEAAIGDDTDSVSSAGTSHLESPEYVIAAFRSGRERLKSGVFTAKATTSMQRSAKDKETRVVEYSCAFDFQQDSVRFDFSSNGIFPIKGKYASSTDASLLVTSDDRVVTRGRAGEFPKGIPMKPFDVRNLGVLDFRVQFSRVEAFEEHMQAIEAEIGKGNVACNQIVENQRTLVACRFFTPSKNAPCWDWILDPSRDFIPIRWERRRADPDGKLMDELLAVMTSDWVDIDGAWVPNSVTYSSNVNGSLDIKLALDWESVNEPVAPATFKIEGLDLEPSAWVIDKRLGKPIVEGTLERRTEAERMRLDLQSGMPLGRLLLVLANAIVFVFLGCMIARRQFTRRL